MKLNGIQEVRGSTPLSSTRLRLKLQGVGNRQVVSPFRFGANVYPLFTTRQIIEQIYRVFQVLMGQMLIAHGHG